MWVTAAVMAGSAVMGMAQGSQAAGASKKATRASAYAQREQGWETARRMKRSQDKTLSTAKAKSHASGVMMSGSNAAYIDSMQDEMVKELQWQKRSTESAFRAQKQGAAVQYQTDMMRTYSQGMQGLTAAAGHAWG